MGKLEKVVEAQRDLIGWYETEQERSCYEDEDIPEELRELEAKLRAASQKRWQPPTKSMVDRCAEELAEAMRQEMETDPQGRTVRAKHCAVIKEKDEEGQVVQKTLWFDRETATPDLMRRSVQQRRKGVLGDVKQLKLDLDSYNDNNIHGAHIQMSFNFERDLEGIEHDAAYNPPPPPEDQED